MIIRTARKDDINTLQNLSDELLVDNQKYDPDLNLYWAQSDTGKEYFTSILSTPNTICLIAEEDGVAIGYIAAAPKDFGYRLGKYIEVEYMGVSPKYRCKGIGSKLMTECFKIAKEKGFQKAYVNSYFENSKAIKFYENMGFNKIDISLEKDI